MQQGEGWNLQKSQVDFYDIKAAVEGLLVLLRLQDATYTEGGREPYLHPNKSVCITAGEQYIGSLGEVHPDVLEKLDIKMPAYAFELDADLISGLWSDAVRFVPFSRQPAIMRDLALIVAKAVPAAKILDAISGFGNKLITEIAIFDSFRGGAIPPDKKSLAFRLKFQSNERTLTDIEVNKIHDRLVAHLARETGAELRQ